MIDTDTCDKCDGAGVLCHLNPGYANPNLCYDAHEGECDEVVCPWCGYDIVEDEDGSMSEEQDLFAQLEAEMHEFDTSEEEGLGFTNMSKLELHNARKAVTKELKALGEAIHVKTERGRELHARLETIAEIQMIRDAEG